MTGNRYSHARMRRRGGHSGDEYAGDDTGGTRTTREAISPRRGWHETVMVHVSFGASGPSVEVPTGTSLHDAARAAGVTLDAPCAGAGRCGNCRVRATGALTPATAEEIAILGKEDLGRGIRLACRARIEGDVGVWPVKPGEVRALGFGVAGDTDPDPLASLAVRSRGPVFGAAVDVGTTTIALALVDLASGAVLERDTGLNPQVADGHDVMSRVTAALDGGAERLCVGVARTIERCILGMLAAQGASIESLVQVVIVGNTAMIGLLLGRDVSLLAAAPYDGGAFTGAVALGAHEVGFEALVDSTQVWIAPGASAFVGGDTTAGLLAAGLDSAEQPSLFVDLGTNGEIVLAFRERFVAASAAAGPALEGATIEAGMRAEPGAIERVELVDGDLVLTTVGAKPPCGICGSGLLDLIAVLLEAGMLETSGRITLPEPADGPLARRIHEVDGIKAIRLADGVDLTQKDVRQVQLAKGAVRSALDLVLDGAEMNLGDIAHVVVAGGFGYHVRPEALVRIGMIPIELGERVVFAGNTALEGAHRLLLSARLRSRAEELAARIDPIDLTGAPDFQVRFVERLAFEVG